MISAQELNNTQAQIKVEDKLNINANELNNAKGEILASVVGIKANNLNNSDTKSAQIGIQAIESLDIDVVDRVDNSSGLILAGKSKFKTKELINDNANIQAIDGLDIDATNKLTSKQGLILANNIKLVSKAIDNTQGSIQAVNTLDINATDKLDNQNGEILAKTASIKTKQLNNQTAYIGVEESLDILVASLDNSNQSNIVAKNIQLVATMVNNTDSNIIASNEITLKTDTLANNNSQINANNNLILIGNKTASIQDLSNDNGKLISGNNLSLEANTFANRGEIQAKIANIKINGNYTEYNTLLADTLNLLVSGKITNHKHIGANTKLSLTSDSLDNKVSGEINGGSETQLLVKNKIQNYGLIDGQLTHIKADKLENIGTGRIYANHLAIDSKNILNTKDSNNGKSAIIAARNRLDLAGNKIVNYDKAQIISDGIMVIGGALDNDLHATGLADELYNQGATIENISNQLTVWGVKNTYNENINFKPTEKVITTSINEKTMTPFGTNHKFDLKYLYRCHYERRGNGYSYCWKQDPITANNKDILGKVPLRIATNSIIVRNKDIGPQAVPAKNAIYLADSPIWKYFDIEAPDNAPEMDIISLKEPIKSRRIGSRRGAIDRYGYVEKLQPYLKWQAENTDKFVLLNAKIKEYNRNFGSNSSQIYDTSHGGVWIAEFSRSIDTKTVVEESQPGQIILGGNLELKGDVVNDKSRIIIGGSLIGDIDSIKSIGAKGKHTTEKQGVKFKEIKRRHKSRRKKPRYNTHVESRQEYKIMVQEEAIDLPVVETLFNTNITHNNTEIANNQHSVDIEYTANQTTNNQVSSGLNIDQAKVAELNLNKVDLGSSKIDSAQTHKIDNIKHNLSSVKLPTSSLYIINNGAAHKYLIETDPRFANYKHWLNSDYMLDKLKYDHANLHKRLGDGYYEQRLITEQIAQLTGRNYLANYSSYEEQYKALMDSGITVAHQLNLTPGIKLTASQIQQLTNDIVWFEHANVALADGSIETVLVPKVYVALSSSNNSNQGSLISAKTIQLNIKNDLDNSGKIKADFIDISANKDINNSGNIVADKVLLAAKNDINNLAGAIQAEHVLALDAGNNVNLTDITNTKNKLTYIAKTNSLAVNKDGLLSVKAGNTINTKAGSIKAEQGKVILAAENVNLDTVKLSYAENLGWGDHTRNTLDTSEVGTEITAKDIIIHAKDKAKFRQAEVNATDKLHVQGDNGVEITAGDSSYYLDEHHKVVHKGTFSKTTQIKDTRQEGNIKVASNFTGAEVNIVTKQGDIDIIGSNVVADNELNLVGLGGNSNVNIKADKNTHKQEDISITKKSGLMGTGGIGFTIGSKTNTDKYEQDNILYSEARSQVGSLNGKVNIQAGNKAHITSSDVLAQDDINIIAKQVTVDVDKDILKNKETHEMKQSGFTVAFSSIVTDAAQAVINTAKSAEKIGKSKNNRVNAMAAVNTSVQGYNAYQGAQSAMDQPMGSAKGTNAVKISITYGEQKNVSTTERYNENAVGSNIQSSAGKVNIVATGADKNSNIDIIGSDIAGAQGTNLIADNNVNILAAEQISSERSKNKSEGFNAGVAVSIGQGGPAMGFTAGGNIGKGYGNGDGVSHQNAHVGHRDSQTVIVAGGDTNIKGAQVIGKGVAIDTTNLNIESLQAKEKYHGKQENISAEITVGYGVSGSASYSKSKVNSDYASVQEQAGVFAGDDGYQVRVKEKTKLTGAAIVSTADKEKNYLSSKDFEYTDIENYAHASASSAGISGGFAFNGSGEKPEHLTAQNPNATDGTKTLTGMDSFEINNGHTTGKQGHGKYAVTKTIAQNLLNNAKVNASDSSITRSIISDGNFIIGNDSGKANIESISKASQIVDTKLAKINTSDLEQDVAVIQEFKNNITDAFFSGTDDVYQKKHMYERKIYEIARDKETGRIKSESETGYPVAKEIDISQLANLKKDKDGKVHIAVNGILNGIFEKPERAVGYAYQNYNDLEYRKDITQYLIHEPESTGWFGYAESLLGTTYDRYLNNDALGLSNGAKIVKDVQLTYGDKGIVMGVHSNAGHIWQAASDSILKDKNNLGKLPELKVIAISPATNVDTMDKTLANLQGRKPSEVKEKAIQYECNQYDFVCAGPIGRNKPTYATHKGDKVNHAYEVVNVMKGVSTTHNSGGTGMGVIGRDNSTYRPYLKYFNLDDIGKIDRINIDGIRKSVSDVYQPNVADKYKTTE